LHFSTPSSVAHQYSANDFTLAGIKTSRRDSRESKTRQAESFAAANERVSPNKYSLISRYRSLSTGSTTG
jgi:hypothetical protein